MPFPPFIQINQPWIMNKLPQILRNKSDRSITLMLDKPKFSLVWLHGLGDSAQGFFEYFLHHTSPLHIGARIRLLTAPERPVTINGGYKFNSWYDIKSIGGRDSGSVSKEDLPYSLEEIADSAGIIEREVKKELEYWAQNQSNNPMNIHPNHLIYVGGFSQGCAMSLHYGLEAANPVAGIVGFSGYLFPTTKLNNLHKTHILLNHGQYDSMIPEYFAKSSYEKILKSDQVSYKVIPGMDHTVTIEQLKEMTTWIEKRHKQMEQYYGKKK